MQSHSGKSANFISKLIIIPVLLIIILTLTAVTRETYKKNQIQKEIDGLQAKARQIEKENSDIQEKITYFESPDYQAKEAKDKLNLQDPQESVVVINPGIAKEEKFAQAEPGPVTVTAPEASNLAKWWNYFFRY